MTSYIVFANTDDGGPRWQEVGTYDARNARAAIHLHLNERQADETFNGHQYAAVPERSWCPLKVSVETKTALKFQ